MSSKPWNECFVSLPPELQRIIVEIAALSSPRTAAALALVSRTFLCWVAPVVYETIILHSSLRDPHADSESDVLGEFHYRLTNEEAGSVPISKHVRTLHLLTDVSLRDRKVLQEALDECKSLENLSLDPFAVRLLTQKGTSSRHGSRRNSAYDPLSSSTSLQPSSFRPRKLEIYARSPSLPLPFERAFYENVTHLHVSIFVIHRIAIMAENDNFNMPNLTHLAFEMPPGSVPWTWAHFSESMDTILRFQTLSRLVLWLPNADYPPLTPKFPLIVDDCHRWVFSFPPIRLIASFVHRIIHATYETLLPAVDGRVVICTGPIPRKEGYKDGHPLVYRRMPDAIWEWADQVGRGQRVYLDERPAIVSAISESIVFWILWSAFLAGVLTVAVCLTTASLRGGLGAQLDALANLVHGLVERLDQFGYWLEQHGL